MKREVEEGEMQSFANTVPDIDIGAVKGTAAAKAGVVAVCTVVVAAVQEEQTAALEPKLNFASWKIG